jgi:hypothetical protein
MNGEDYLLGLLYNVRGRFGRLGAFMRALPFDASALPYDAAPLRDAVDRTIAAAESRRGLIGREQAKMLVVAVELRQVRARMSDQETLESLASRHAMRPVLEARLSDAVNLLREYGVVAGVTNVYIVDKFPEPYQDREYAVLAADAGDERSHGIAPGLYFLERGVRPYYSEFLVCHEVLHVVLGNKNPELLAHGLEEGLAEVLGSIHLSRRVLGTELTRNIFVYNRLNDNYHPLWEQYLDFARMAAYILQRYGLAGLLDLARRGRPIIKDVEGQLLQGSGRDLPIEKGAVGPEDLDLVDYLFSLYPRSLVVSPLAYLVAPYALPGASTREVLGAANVAFEDGLEALEELENEFSLLGLRKDRSVVLWSDCPLYAPSLRYKLQ